ncbi:MAG: hypothetical protein H3C47_06930 [Candidatus Cloacimonetes bacterium]|nr:hypothetical protein [Candidatus Cloacimonadota bacterium]
MKRKIVVIALVCGFLGSSYAFDGGYADDFDQAVAPADQGYQRFRSNSNRFSQSAPSVANKPQAVNRQNQWNQAEPDYQESMDDSHSADYYSHPAYNHVPARAQMPNPNNPRPRYSNQPQYQPDFDDQGDFVINDQTGKKMYLKDLQSQNQPMPNRRQPVQDTGWAEESYDEAPVQANSHRNVRAQAPRQPSSEAYRYDDPAESYAQNASPQGPQRREAAYSQGYANRAMGREELSVAPKQAALPKAKQKRSSGGSSLNPFRMFQRLNPFR